ncbi:MAG: family 10 glycosylhydrolase [Ignavibacteriales bacterium]|nr:family 10 glycosylhydrolase [Ignavibacteriales bacterium]
MKRAQRALLSSQRQLRPASFFLSLLLTVVFGMGCGQAVFTGKREARGVWMSRFEYSTDRLRNNPAAAQQFIRSVFQKARRARLNMVFFQVRGSADAFYHSDHEPWSSLLTGSLGKDPGWDPLAFAVEEAHALGLELHAWMNTFPLWRGTRPPEETVPRHPFLEHPEWIVCDSAGTPMPPGSDYTWASPGIPAVREHVLNVVRDLVSKYDIDGIHFDYIRYPEDSPQRGYSTDSISVARFLSAEGNPHQLTWSHWQREQVNEFVYAAYNAVTTIKPWVKMSAAVIGKYRGSGWSSYFAVYQDPARWMELGKIDFIVPMVYWDRGHPTHPFVPLIMQWQDRVAYDRQVMPGLSANLQKKYGWSELAAQVEEVRKHGLPGVVFFAASGLEQAWETLGIAEFPYWSLPPAMPWKDSLAPPPPANLRAESKAQTVLIRWTIPSAEESLAFVIYRSATGRIDRDDVTQLLTITGRNVSEYVDAIPPPGRSFYAVSALDRSGNESGLSNVVRLPSHQIAEAR